MVAKKASDNKKFWLLIVALLVVALGGVLFVGAVSGWFSGPEMAMIDQEYYCDAKCVLELKDIDIDEYEKMISEKRSFVVFVDQGGCDAADRLREYADRYSNGERFTIFRAMFSDVKGSSLGEKVKYYPSMVIISKGKVLAWLRADSNDDAPAYNNYEDFENWMRKYLKR